MTDTVKLLSDDEVAELQARPSTELGGYRRVLLRPRERDALCATVRALREQFKSMKSKVAWHRDGAGPDVPVLQERYDRLIAERNKFSKLADERHDLLSAEKRANDALREQLAQSQRENTALRDDLKYHHEALEELRRHRDRWLTMLNPATAETAVDDAIRSLQSQLAQVTQESDEWRAVAEKYQALVTRTETDTATRMRDRCVEKVEEYRRRIQYEKDEGMREALFGDMVIDLQSMPLVEGETND